MCIPEYILTTFFCFGRFLNTLADDQWTSITKGGIYHIKHNNIHTTFYHGSGLTWNCTFNGSIYHVRYLHILCFYFVRQNLCYKQVKDSSLNKHYATLRPKHVKTKQLILNQIDIRHVRIKSLLIYGSLPLPCRRN